MELVRKLQVPAGAAVAVLGLPDGVELDLPGPGAAEADAVLAFARSAAELDTVAAPAFAAAREDRLAWVAYPKAGQLGTDLSRGRLAEAARVRGVQPVRQVAVDEVWSALRLRPL